MTTEEHVVTNNCPGYETGECANPEGEHKTADPNIVIIPEKTSAWKEEEKAPAAPEPPKVPAWVADFPPGSIFLANGWQCVIRHTGEGNPGVWMVLVEPVEKSHTRGQRRAEFRRLTRSVGKKKARELMAAKEA